MTPVFSMHNSNIIIQAAVLYSWIYLGPPEVFHTIVKLMDIMGKELFNHEGKNSN